MDGRDVIAAHYLVASERIVDTLTRHWLAKAWIQKKRGCIYTCHQPNQPIPKTKRWQRHSSVCSGSGALAYIRDGLASFAFPLRFGFPLPSHLASKARTGRSPETGFAQRYRARKDLAPHANRDSVSECTHTLQASLVAFQVRSRSCLSALASSPNKHAAATCRPDMQSSAIFLKQTQWCMTGSSALPNFCGLDNYGLHRKLLRLKDGGTLYVHILTNCQSTN